MSSSSEPDDYSRTNCDCCGNDIPGIGIECAECSILTQICCECFGLQAEIGEHKSTHKYRFFDTSGDLFLYPKDSTVWASKEHRRLIEGIEMFGHGNWTALTKYIQEGVIESKDVKVHTDVKTGKLKWPLCKSLDPGGPGATYPIVDDGPLRPSITTKLPPLMISNDEAGKLGCTPLTDDYEVEHDNDAEYLVSELKYNPEDEEIGIALTLALVDIYTTRLRERDRRKRIIRDYQLVNEFFKKKSDRRRKSTTSPFEKDFTDLLQPFAQLHTANVHSHIIQNMLKERELRFRLQELNKYRQNGITMYEDCADFDRYTAKKNGKMKMNGNGSMNGNEKPSTSVNSKKETYEQQFQKKRKRRRLLLTRQKSHTEAVLLRIRAKHHHKVNGKLHKKPGNCSNTAFKASSEAEPRESDETPTEIDS